MVLYPFFFFFFWHQRKVLPHSLCLIEFNPFGTPKPRNIWRSAPLVRAKFDANKGWHCFALCCCGCTARFANVGAELHSINSTCPAGLLQCSTRSHSFDKLSVTFLSRSWPLHCPCDCDPRNVEMSNGFESWAQTWQPFALHPKSQVRKV